MPTIGQQVTYVTFLGDVRVGFISWVGASTNTLHVFLLSGDSDYAKFGPVGVYNDVVQDATGAPGTWH